MKKTLFLLSLLTPVVCLTACGSKDFNMTFEEALENINNSELKGFFIQDGDIEQDFHILGNYDDGGIKVAAEILQNSKQNISSKVSESSTSLNADVEYSGENLNVDGTLDAKFIDDILYLNITSFDLTGNDGLAMVGMMVEGFKNQWFSIPVTGLNDAYSTLPVLRNLKETLDIEKDILINEGFVTYNGAFVEFNGYNARKISLDNEKLNDFIKLYYETVNTGLDESIQEIPEIDIQNFEGYLVITGKDKVTIVIENMAIAEDDVLININGFVGEDFMVYVSEGDEDIVTINATKKGSKYKILATITDAIRIEGEISPKLSKSSFDLNFEATITIKSESEKNQNIVIPFKGFWKYNLISGFTTEIPENAQDLEEILGSYLEGVLGLGDYEDYDYEDYDEYGDYSDFLYDEDYEFDDIIEPGENSAEELSVE